MLRTHLTNVEDTASRHPSRIAFKIPHVDATTRKVDHWNDVTFRQFLLDIEQFARYWFHILSKQDDLPQRSIIGVCLRGRQYIDVLHVYGVSRAGYIIQLIHSFPNADPAVIQGLLEQGKASALIFDSAFENSVHGILALPKHAAFASVEVAYSIDDAYSLLDVPKVDGRDLALIVQTSGTTAGSGSLVPCDYIWLDALVRKAALRFAPPDPNKQDIMPWKGGICFTGQFSFLVGTVAHASCMVQLTNPDGKPSTHELVETITRCKINRINEHPARLTKHLQVARTNPEVLSVFAGLEAIIYAGSSLPSADQEWAWQNDINLVNGFACTQCSVLLISEGSRKSRRNLLLPLSPLYKFLPFNSSDENSSDSLLELVIPPEAPDCPHKTLRSKDGNFYTHDLFREVEPGKYEYCGRNDDWINMEIGKLCDTKTIEDNVRDLCSDIISECAVVGSGRPSPVLIVESDVDTERRTELAIEIFRRISPFHLNRRDSHERVTSEKMIIVIAPGTLPRTTTKGNVRRKAAEEIFDRQLDYLFDSQLS